MEQIFKSIFADEFNTYLEFSINAGRNVKNIKCYLKNLDSYLIKQNLSTKILTEQMLSAWLAEKKISNQSRAHIINILSNFSKYVESMDFKIFLPEKPKVTSDYVPYIFSDDEIKQIVYAADNYQGHITPCRSSVQFPIVFRILYGCGLRLGEALSLTWTNVKTDTGILMIRKAKNQKQRIVPMNQSLNSLLIRYKNYVDSRGICKDYLFESKPLVTYKPDTFHEWFTNILKNAGIKYIKHKLRERGPCPHCLRHLFTVSSFKKSAASGRTFTDTAPILSAYLGHDSIMETEKYLRASYLIYDESQAMVNSYIGDIFPQGVTFE